MEPCPVLLQTFVLLFVHIGWARACVESIVDMFLEREHVPIRYGQKGARQFATAPDTAPFLSPEGTKYIQSTTGTFLYYGRAIDYTIIPALN